MIEKVLHKQNWGVLVLYPSQWGKFLFVSFSFRELWSIVSSLLYNTTNLVLVAKHLELEMGLPLQYLWCIRAMDFRCNGKYFKKLCWTNFFVIVLTIWKERNVWVFNNTSCSIEQMQDLVWWRGPQRHRACITFKMSSLVWWF